MLLMRVVRIGCFEPAVPGSRASAAPVNPALTKNQRAAARFSRSVGEPAGIPGLNRDTHSHAANRSLVTLVASCLAQ